MRIAVPFLALLVLLAGVAPVVALADAGASSTATDQPALSESPPARIDSPTLTELYIDPDPDGDARWTISVRYALDSDADRAAFRDYARSFEAGDVEAGPGVSFFRTLADEAGGATGREMAIRDPDRNATLQNETGVLRLSFTWTNFVTDTERGFVIQESVLMPENRTWLSSIGPAQRLVVETPEDYQVTDSRFGLDNGSVVVDGPHQFRDPLTISYQETQGPDPSSIPWPLVVGTLLLFGIVGAAVYARSRDVWPTADEDTDASDDPPAPAATTPDTDAPETDAGDGERDEQATDVDPELLSDEERVEHLLDQNGGRMKQARIVQETGWSDAKVSQLLSTMADDGRIEKLRLGRENLISLPDDEP